MTERAALHRIASITVGPLPLLGLVIWMLLGCRASGPRTPLPHHRVALTLATPLLERYAQSWHLPPAAQTLRGMRLLADAPVPAVRVAAVTRAIVRSNLQIGTFDALILATHAVSISDRDHLDFGFFCSTLLQESGFAPDALSSAGAVGIAQFTIDTAEAVGVDPFDWRDAMRGAAALLGSYVRAYDGVYPDPYAAALAAYDAGPGAVAAYRGIPPYAETRDYVADIYLRWARIATDSGGPKGPGAERRSSGSPHG